MLKKKAELSNPFDGVEMKVVYLIGEDNHDFYDIKFACLSKETAEKRFNEVKAEILKFEKKELKWLMEDIENPPAGEGPYLPEWIEYMKEKVKGTELDIKFIEAHKFGEDYPQERRWCTVPSWEEKKVED